jgi:Rod binding domain-containing protein
MDGTKLILTNPVSLPSPLVNLDISRQYPEIATGESGKVDEFSQDKKKQIAKDFESVLINKLLEEMKNTIEDWGFGKDEASKQVQGIFWLNLAQDIANKGGFGFWKDIYQFLIQAEGSRNTGAAEHKDTMTEPLNESA